MHFKKSGKKIVGVALNAARDKGRHLCRQADLQFSPNQRNQKRGADALHPAPLFHYCVTVECSGLGQTL
jgi:hypothetical protein